MKNILSNWMEDDGIRLQIEAENKQELTEPEWKSVVEEWFTDVIDRARDCSMSIREAYLDVLQ